MMLPRALLPIALATAGLATSAGSVAAECSVPPDAFPHTPYMFVATVAEVSRDTAPPLPDAADFDWRIALRIERTYAGDLPGRVEANGWDAGCGFTGLRVGKGERLLIAATRLDLADPRLVLGEVLVWRHVSADRWEFYADALHDGAFGYPVAAVEADTTAEILSVLRRLAVSDTSTVSAGPSTEGANERILLLALILAAATLAASRWLSYRSSGA